MPRLRAKKKPKHAQAPQDTAAVKTRKGNPTVDSHAMMNLQRMAGNRAVTELVQPNHDLAETPSAQDSRAKPVLFKTRAGGIREPENAAEVRDQLQAGQPLDADLRGKMERAFGQDFSEVRIHDDANAARVSDKFNARAFTVGKDVAFAEGELQPDTLSGEALLAHELAHIVQQRQGRIHSAQSRDEATYDALEQDADSAAGAAVNAARQGANRDAGSQTMPHMRSGLQIQRADAVSKYPVLDVSALPEGVIRDAVTELSQSDAELERNTARQLAEGNLHAYYIEDLTTPPGADAKLKSLGADPAIYTILLHPVTGDEIYAQKNFRGFAMGKDIFGVKSDPIAEWKMTLVHETSHAVNPDAGSSLLEKFKTEFRAYWVADYANVSDPDDRARQVKARVLQDYAAINDAYNTDPAIKTAIDSYTRPEGDVTNVTGLKQTTTP